MLGPLFGIVLSCLSLITALPDAVFLEVPYHRQETNYACGDASLQMVMNYWGPVINQFEIMKAMRTTQAEGTLSLDMPRGASFSVLSEAAGINRCNPAVPAT